MSQRPLQAVILVGAARSGTKLLRDLLAAHPTVACVPYDVNFVWRSGTERLAHDELDVSDVTPAKVRRIRRQLARFQGEATVVVEKTVSNCLRVPFVHAVVPDAKVIHLVRDGRDVVVSARQEWTAPTDWRYVRAKALTFPSVALRRYGIEYATRLVRRVARTSAPPPTWGPRYRGIDEDLARLGVLETAARQWSVCVERALDGVATLPAAQVRTVRYEDLVADPHAWLAQLWSFIGVAPPEGVDVAARVERGSVGRYRGLPDDELDAAMRHLRGPLTRLGYPVSAEAGGASATGSR